MLKKELIASQKAHYPTKDITEEMNAINLKIWSASVNRLIYYNLDSLIMDTTITVNLRLKSRMNTTEHQMLQNLLFKRLKNKRLKVIVE